MLFKLLHARWFQLMILCIVLGFIVYMINNNFTARLNIFTLMRGLVVPGIMIVAVGPLLAGGGIDLAASAEATLGSLIFVNLLIYTYLPWPVALILAMIAGGVFGLVNVFLVNVMNFHAFIATIGMTSVYLGFSDMWTGRFDVMIRHETSVGLRANVIEVGRMTMANNWVPVLFLAAVILIAIYVYMMANTRFGRSIYMVGGNPAAARLAGLNPKRVRAILFVNSGAMSVLAGCAWAMQNRMAQSTGLITLMPNFTALTAVIIGGVSFMGGSGTLAAGFFGMVLVRVFDNGLMWLGFNPYINTAAQGMILIIALIVDNIGVMRQRRALIAAAMATVDKKSKA